MNNNQPKPELTNDERIESAMTANPHLTADLVHSTLSKAGKAIGFSLEDTSFGEGKFNTCQALIAIKLLGLNKWQASQLVTLIKALPKNQSAMRSKLESLLEAEAKGTTTADDGILSSLDTEI